MLRDDLMIRLRRPTATTGASAIHELQRTPRRRTNLGGIQRRTALNPAAKACSFAQSERFEQRGRRTAPQRPSASTSDFNLSLDGFHTTLACWLMMATSLGSHFSQRPPAVNGSDRCLA